MKPRPAWGVATLFLVLMAACNSVAMPARRTNQAQTPADDVAGRTATVQPIAIQLPLVFNGSQSTPTPYLPVAPTPAGPSSSTAPETAESQVKVTERTVTPVPPPMPLLGDQASAGDDLVNILLIGADQRKGTKFRTDTLIIASIRPQLQVVTLISIPRDLFVYIPGWTMQRINTAYLHGEVVKYPGGGGALLKETILYNLGVRIDHLAIVNFDGFKKIVDTLEGIDLPIFCPYTDWRAIDPKGDLEDPDNWYLFTVEPGVVHMDGELALWYARSRLHSNDYDRGRRQQEVLRGLYTRAMRVDVIPRLPELYQQVSDLIKTDMSFEDVLKLASMAPGMDASHIRSFYINNRLVKAWWTPEGANVLLPKRDNIALLIQEAMSPPDAGEETRQEITVEIMNNTPNEGWEYLAAERLQYAGFETQPAQAGDIDPSKTWLYDLSGGAPGDQAAAILEIFGIPSDRLVVVDPPPGEAQYQLVVGADFNPCFNPSKVNH